MGSIKDDDNPNPTEPSESDIISGALMGRPKKPIELDEVEKLCMLQCTQEELAAFFDVGIATIERRAREKRFREAMERGYAKGRISVRRKQMQLLDEGSNTMAVWLGKQLLGQKDQHELTGAADGPIELDVSASDELISTLSSLITRATATTDSEST
jgi:hypothetical protein